MHRQGVMLSSMESNDSRYRKIDNNETCVISNSDVQLETFLNVAQADC